MSDGETRIAYFGKSFIDARERQQKGEDNQVTAQQMQQWLDGNDRGKKEYARSLVNNEDGDFFYALHICKENCKRKNNTKVGGGSLTFNSESWAGSAPHFKRRIGGTVDLCDGICDAKTIFENDNKLGEKERAPNNPQMKNILRLKLDENNQPSIKKLFVEIVQWPQRIDDNTKERIKDYLGNQLGRRSSDGDYILVNKEYDNYNQTEPRLSYVDGGLEANLWMKCFKKNTIRIFRHRGRMNQAGREKIGDFYEWIGEQKGGERNFKYDKNDLLLLWIPDKDDNCTDDSDWRDRCEDNVEKIIDELETDNLTKGSFKTFRNKKYKGFFILIGNRKQGKGDQIPFLKAGNPINRLFAALKESRRNTIRRIPLYSFSQKEASMRITWLDGNNVFHAHDDGLEHSLQSIDGEVSIIVSLNEIEEDQDNKFKTSIQLKLIDKNGLKEFKGKAFIVDGKNASISLRFKKKGDYRLLLKTSNSQFRKLHISVKNDSNNPNTIYCQKEGWIKWAETKVTHRYVAEPKSQKKLMQKIIKKEFPKLNNYIEYNDSEWKKKKNRNGLMMEINRAAFQLIQKKTGKSYVDGGSWTRKTREIYSSIEWLHWPNMEDDERLEVPQAGYLQIRGRDRTNGIGMLSNLGTKAIIKSNGNLATEDEIRNGIDIAWVYGHDASRTHYYGSHVNLTKHRGILFSYLTFKQMLVSGINLWDRVSEPAENSKKYSGKIYIDYKTGIRYFDVKENIEDYEWMVQVNNEKDLIGDGWTEYEAEVKEFKIDRTNFPLAYQFSLPSYEFRNPEWFLSWLWDRLENNCLEAKVIREGWKRKRFSYSTDSVSKKTKQLKLYDFARTLAEDSQKAESSLQINWTNNFAESMGVDLGPEGKWKRRQLYLEIEYYITDIEYKAPVNLYLGCLYSSDLEMKEKRFKISSEKGWKEDRQNKYWKGGTGLNIDGSPLSISIIEKITRPINTFSDTRYFEREVLRSFRTTLERENDIKTGSAELNGKDIPAIFYVGKDAGWMIWNEWVDGLSRCLPDEYNDEELEKIKLNYQRKILKKLWWNVDES